MLIGKMQNSKSCSTVFLTAVYDNYGMVKLLCGYGKYYMVKVRQLKHKFLCYVFCYLVWGNCCSKDSFHYELGYDWVKIQHGSEDDDFNLCN